MILTFLTLKSARPDSPSFMSTFIVVSQVLLLLFHSSCSFRIIQFVPHVSIYYGTGTI